MTMTDQRDGIADYKFLRQLGVGSHGAFYLAHPPKRLPVAAEFVAVKVLSGGSSQDVFRWAHRELAAFAAVSSPYLLLDGIPARRLGRRTRRTTQPGHRAAGDGECVPRHARPARGRHRPP